MGHPLIIPLHDSGAAGEVLFYVMPYVEGETLGQRLERVRRLPLEDALAVAHDVADALGHAHRQGILHRDVKPENILLAGGRALVADFGLARAIGAANYQKLTDTGVLVGTVYYMSPEQVRDDRDLDQRTDIYALGCILYEMITGEPPYTGRGLTEVASRILQGPIPSARHLVPDVPPGLDAAIGRALAKRAEERFGSMGLIADNVLAGGGEVYGVIPTALVNLEVAHTGVTRLYHVETMHERKAKMTDLADAFLALPGGIGTLDELFEAWSWNALGYHAKPFCLLNVDGFWDGMIEFIDHATDSGFLSAKRRSQLLVAATPGQALELLDEAAAAATQGMVW